MPLDWPHLRRRSLLPGGFGEDRVHIWPRLLNVDPARLQPSSSKSEFHRDEYQIKLDTARSFVLYPPNSSDGQRTRLQKDLHQLIIALFHKRPKLNYFQGYHDIVSVLFLTLPEELQLVCLEKLSLHRLRDSMGQGLEPVLGLLRLTKKLIRLADPDMSAMLDQSSQLPFFALSNLLTLFSHDMPSLPLIQHVFDYLLCRPPIAVVYLATAIILSRKEEVRRLQDEDEDGMIHSLLSSLPHLVDDVEPQLSPERENQVESNDIEPSPAKQLPNGTAHSANDEPTSADDTDITIVVNQSSSTSPDEDKDESETEAGTERTSFSPLPESELTLVDTVEAKAVPNPKADGEEESTAPTKRVETTTQNIANPNSKSTPSTPDATKIPLPASRSPTPTPPCPAHLHPSPPSIPSSRSPSPSPSHIPLTLTAFLTSADALYKLYPPTHPQLSLSLIMGPQSIIHTWSQNFRDWPSDNDAEVMVTRPDLVVYPYDPQFSASEDDSDSEGGESESVGEEHENARRGRKGGKRRKRRKLTKSPKQYQKHKEKAAKKHKKRFGFVRSVEKRAMLTGAVVVLGIAMTMYGVKNGGKGASGGRHWPWSW